MKRASVLTCALTLATAGLAVAQAPKAPPKPGPEHKKLGYFVGKWTMEADMKPGPLGPGGKMTASETCEWFAGGFHVVCRNEGKGPMGETKGLGILTYNAEERTYVYYGIDNMGTAETGKGSVAGDMWTWLGESKMGGKPVKSRFTMKELPPNAYSFKWEMSEDGKAWSLVSEGKETHAVK